MYMYELIDNNLFNKCYQAIPIFWSIMTNKSEECYLRVFNFIKEKFPSFNPKTYMSDFEIGMHNAVETAFPDIDANHCYFHYAQAINKNARDLGLINKTTIKVTTHPEIYVTIKQLIALALLPPKLIISTFNNLKEVVTQDFGQRFDRLFDYYERFWIKTIKPRGFSVYNLREDKTDNYEESCNRNLNDLLKKTRIPINL
ncbi:uncharacterized protein LOC128667616 [Microplitis demolitor]|uniref:uncharacterized protein LOC128667616 n=1 Tax=Microplitis demolitor TaxID=69319 RepID=UPI00235B5D59|nr:uncharacterized protein LOC128667616 [Microplitis demolitor]